MSRGPFYLWQRCKVGSLLPGASSCAWPPAGRHRTLPCLTSSTSLLLSRSCALETEFLSYLLFLTSCLWSRRQEVPPFPLCLLNRLAVGLLAPLAAAQFGSLVCWGGGIPHREQFSKQEASIWHCGPVRLSRHGHKIRVQPLHTEAGKISHDLWPLTHSSSISTWRGCILPNEARGWHRCTVLPSWQFVQPFVVVVFPHRLWLLPLPHSHIFKYLFARGMCQFRADDLVFVLFSASFFFSFSL